MYREIKEGKHRSKPMIFGLHWKKRELRYQVRFDVNCRYTLKGGDQLDWNKLYGMSYGLHHENSVRVVWRFNPKYDMIELGIYEYIKGRRLMPVEVVRVNIGNTVDIKLQVGRADNLARLTVESDGYYRNLKSDTAHTPTWGYLLGLYFGGNQPAPCNMNIWMRKI